MITAFKLRSTFLCKAGALSAVTLAAVLLAPVAHAQVTLLTNASQLTSGDTVIGFTNFAVGSTLPYPYTTSSGSQTLTFTNNSTPANGNHFERNVQQGLGVGSGSAGDFLPGTQLLVNAVIGSGPANALTMTFSDPVSEVGFQWDTGEFLLPADYTINVFQNGIQTFTFTKTGVTNANRQNGSAPFFGAKASTNSITSVVIYGTDSLNNGVNADSFFLAPVSVGTIAAVAVPEPGIIALLAGAGLPVGLLALRRRRHA